MLSVWKSHYTLTTYLSNIGGTLLVLDSESKYLFPITPRTNPGLAVVTRNGFEHAGVLGPIPQNLTRRGDQSESKDSISSAPEFLAAEAKQGGMPLFSLAVGGRGAARETRNQRQILANPSLGTFSANPSSGILSAGANPSSQILSDPISKSFAHPTIKSFTSPISKRFE